MASAQLPYPLVGWTPSYNSTRGTLDLIFTCFFTLTICTWTLQHLNLPGPHDSLAAKLLRKIKWTAVTILAPEYLAALALDQRFAAAESVRQMRALAERLHTQDREDDAQMCREWTIAHGYFALMGGWVLEVQAKKVDADKAHEAVAGRELDSFADMLRKRRLAFFPADPVSLNLRQLLFLVEEGVGRLPIISEIEIWDKSKGDGFVKGIALWQVIWLVVQCCVRRANWLPLSQLEIATLAYSVCTIIIYVVWWKKPLDVETPIRLVIEDVPHASVVNHLIQKNSNYLLSKPRWPTDSDIQFPIRQLNNTLSHYDGGYGLESIGMVVIGVTFGAIHLIAWNYEFPTRAERILWRTSTMVTVAFMPLYAAFWGLVSLALRNFPDCNGEAMLSKLRVFIIIPVYGIARLCIIAETLASLRAQPKGVYESTWTKNMPHFA